MNLVIIILIGIIAWVVYTQMPRFYVRKFFAKAENAEFLYETFMKANSDDSSYDIVMPMTYENVYEINEEVEDTIAYYEITSLGDFEEETLENKYKELMSMARELRRWLWVHNDERKKLNA